MSRYGYFACHDCRVTFWLGKALFDGDRVVAFHVGQEGGPPNSKKDLLTQTLWKFIAEHAGHRISVEVEGSDTYESIADYREIGGKAHGDVSMSDYVADFSG